MKKTIYSFIFVLVVLCTLKIENCFAQMGWYELNSGTTEKLYSVYFVDANSGCVVGYTGIVLKTTNAGVNWLSQTVSSTHLFYSVFFTDINTGYIAGGVYGSLDSGNVFKTTNGGANWNALILPKYSQYFYVNFLNPNTGYVTGYQTILKTTNAGSTWESKSFTGLGLITSVYFVDANVGFASEYDNGMIMKTTNGGNDWQEIFVYSGDGGFFSLHFLDSNTGTVVGGNSAAVGDAVILRTTNGGVDWTNIAFNNSNISRLWSVKFVTPSIGYISGGGNTGNCAILKTTNGGINWYFQAANPGNMLNGNYFMNANTGYAVGSNGRIIKTTDGGGALIGIKTESNNVPERYFLSQNYPNPFNSMCNVQFSMHNAGNVKLVVYDVMGREVKTLVNEKLRPGTYETSFDGSMLPSGVYFYKLITEGFSETKRMLMIK